MVGYSTVLDSMDGGRAVTVTMMISVVVVLNNLESGTLGADGTNVLSMSGSVHVDLYEVVGSLVGSFVVDTTGGVVRYGAV